MIWTTSGQPASGSVNCGSSAKNSRNTFGLSALVLTPVMACRTHESAGRSPPAAGAEGRGRGGLPSHTRHAPPTTVSTVTMRSERATRAATPAASTAGFEQAVADIPHVLQAQRLIGDPDYILRTVTRDLGRLPTALRRPPRRAPRRTTPQVHPRHEEHRRKPTPAL